VFRIGTMSGDSPRQDIRSPEGTIG